MCSETNNIINRLMDAEEYDTDVAIPPLAYDAVNNIKALQEENKNLKTKMEFINKIANFRIWDYDMSDGSPYEELEDEPEEGYLDSHMALMDLIEKARYILNN